MNMYNEENLNLLLNILYPQDFDSVIKVFQDALREIDPSWQKGQFDIFSKHFRLQFLRSVFAKRVSLNDFRIEILDETILLEKILLSSRKMSEMEKAAFYGTVLSEYILALPLERFPSWADEQKSKPNWLAHWNLHSTAWYTIYK